PGGPRVAWGGQSVAAAQRAARHGLDFFAQSNQADLEPAYRDECARLGRTPGACALADPTLPLTTFVADDVDGAWAEIGPYLVHDATTYASWNEGDDRTASLSRGSTVDELRAEQGAHRIMAVDEAVDYVRTAGLLALHPLCGGIPPGVAWPYLRRVVDDVLPRVAS
ncbi:MAG: LLM class flavin-dependent oxidoreductase, partial [Acidimicrobiia bacterium]